MPITPDRIMQVGLGFWQSKALLTAVSAGVFTKLANGPKTGGELQAACGWHARGVFDLLDGLVALGFLHRDGDGHSGRYRNTEESALFLDQSQPSYIGGMLEMANARLFRYWADLDLAMQTGEPQTEIKHTGESVFAELYRDEARLRQFLSAMTGMSRGNFQHLAQTFDFSRYQLLCDVGGATGLLCRTVAQQHATVQCTTFDLPPVAAIAREHIDAEGLGDRIKTASGDFFTDPLPKADVIVMSLILHDWNLEKKRHLIQAAYDALPEGGALITIETMIDDERRQNVIGLMMSLNMLIEFGDAFDYSARDFEGWCREIGFRQFERLPLLGPSAAVVAYK